MKNVAQTLRKASRGKGSTKLFEFPLPEQLIGLEVEVDIPDGLTERFQWPEQYAPYWNKTRDGSLRNGSEYVLAAPLSGNMLSNAICKLFDGGTSIYRTTTGSTHIHVDMLEDDTSIASVQVLVLLMFMLEGAVFAACDPGREWCGFTNKLSSAPDSLLGSILNVDLSESSDKFMDAISGYASQTIGRYYGLNLQALAKYGSVEFRYFPTATTSDELASWVVMVQMFKKAAVDIGTVSQLQEIVENESRYNEFIATYFGPWLDAFMKEAPHYKAVSSFQKALATAASQQARCVNNGWSDEFDPRAITGSKLYSKLVKKRKTDAKVRGQLEVLIKHNMDDPTPIAQQHGPILISQGHIFLPMGSPGRITWTNMTIHSVDSLTDRLPVPYVRQVLQALLATRYSVPQSLTNNVQRAVSSYTSTINMLQRVLANNGYTDSGPEPDPEEYESAPEVAGARPVTIDFGTVEPSSIDEIQLRAQNSLRTEPTTTSRWVSYDAATPAPAPVQYPPTSAYQEAVAVAQQRREALLQAQRALDRENWSSLTSTLPNGDETSGESE